MLGLFINALFFGVAPGALLRYVLIKQPVPNRRALVFTTLWLVLLIVVYFWLEVPSESIGAHAGIDSAFFYWMLRRPSGKATPELGAVDAEQEPIPFMLWVQQQEEDISVQDALDRYITQYGLAVPPPGVPEALARQRAEVFLLKELMATLGDSASPEFNSLLFQKHIALASREMTFKMMQEHDELRSDLEKSDPPPSPPAG